MHKAVVRWAEHILTDPENVTSVQASATAPDYDTALDYDAHDSDTTPQIGLCSTNDDIRGPNEEVTEYVFREDWLDFLSRRKLT